MLRTARGVECGPVNRVRPRTTSIRYNPEPPMLIPLCLLALTILPCRFTVRDVAFVDLGDRSYELLTYVADESDANTREELSALCRGTLGESNVEGRVLDPDGPLKRVDEQRLSRYLVQEFPFTMLVAPDGRELVIPWKGDENELETLRLLDSTADSPARGVICEALVECYCVIVLIEGQDAAENQAVRDEIDEALTRLGGIFDRMPKDVGEPPRLVVIAPEEHERERVLCWSLGLDSTAEEAPAVAVLMGRGRRAGPLLAGAALSAEELFGILAMIGLSCECDLDRSWMRGMRIPMRWDAPLRQRAAECLGFDPDNPMVRSEVTSILAHRSDPGPAAGGPKSVNELLLGYRELVVDAAPTAETSPSASPSPEPIPAKVPPAPEQAKEKGAALRNLMIVFATLACLSVLTSLVVLLKTRPR
jgi:hypothetical protein